MNTLVRTIVAALLACGASAASNMAAAAVAVVDVYSTPDGEYQAILLEDDEDDGVDRFRGLTIVMEDARGRVRRWTLTPDRVHEGAVRVDGRLRFLVATRLLSQWLRSQAELPDAFVDTEGGTITLVHTPTRVRPHVLQPGTIVHQHAFLHAAKADAIARHPHAMPWSEADDFFARPLPAPLVREFHHAGLDHYVLAVTQREKADLDAGRHRGWDRTGKYFRAIADDASSGLTTAPVCRYYLPPPYGDTHFYSAFAHECDNVARTMPGAVLEAREAFRVVLPEMTTGQCVVVPVPEASAPPLGLAPVHRAWNGRADANHRYVTAIETMDEMRLRGWIAEGYGPDSVAMCVDTFDVGVIAVPKARPRAAEPNW